MSDTGREKIIPEYVKDIKIWRKRISDYFIRVENAIDASDSSIHFNEQGYKLHAKLGKHQEHVVLLTRDFFYNSGRIYAPGEINFRLKEDLLGNEEMKFYLKLNELDEEIPICHRWEMGGRICGHAVNLMKLRLDDSTITSAVNKLSQNIYQMEIDNYL